MTHHDAELELLIARLNGDTPTASQEARADLMGLIGLLRTHGLAGTPVVPRDALTLAAAMYAALGRV